MTLNDYREALKQNPQAYPLLMEAVEAMAGALAGDAEVHPAREGTKGAFFCEEPRSYWWGYWWPVPFGNLFAGINLMFEWRGAVKSPASSASITWIPLTDTSGYAAYIELRKGTRHDGKIVAMLSLEAFIDSLGEEGAAALGKKIEKASVGVYDQSQLRGPEKP